MPRIHVTKYIRFTPHAHVHDSARTPSVTRLRRAPRCRLDVLRVHPTDRQSHRLDVLRVHPTDRQSHRLDVLRVHPTDRQSHRLDVLRVHPTDRQSQRKTCRRTERRTQMDSQDIPNSAHARQFSRCALGGRHHVCPSAGAHAHAFTHTFMHACIYIYIYTCIDEVEKHGCKRVRTTLEHACTRLHISETCMCVLCASSSWPDCDALTPNSMSLAVSPQAPWRIQRNTFTHLRGACGVTAAHAPATNVHVGARTR
jgi:hypothetical protein